MKRTADKRGLIAECIKPTGLKVNFEQYITVAPSLAVRHPVGSDSVLEFAEKRLEDSAVAWLPEDAGFGRAVAYSPASYLWAGWEPEFLGCGYWTSGSNYLHFPKSASKVALAVLLYHLRDCGYYDAVVLSLTREQACPHSRTSRQSMLKLASLRS